MMKKTFLLTLCIIASGLQSLTSQNADTIVVELAGTTKMVLTMGNKRDLEYLKTLDFQALFDDIIDKLDTVDVTEYAEDMDSGEDHNDADEEDTWGSRDEEDDEEDDEEEYEDGDEDDEDEDDEEEDDEDRYDDDDDEDHDRDHFRGHRSFRTHQSFNFDFGINSFLENGNFPDEQGAQYAVRPWGSWYVGINSIQRTDISRKVYIEWGIGVSWYNFKFQDDETRLIEEADGIAFIRDTSGLSFVKSKLSVTYLNASFIPMFSSRGHDHHSRFWNGRHNSFRIGLGPYVGYRLASYTKQVYKIDGEQEYDRERDNFYLNNLRYGVRLQVGIDGADFFLSYDLNELFAENKGPQLNAFTFGVIF